MNAKFTTKFGQEFEYNRWNDMPVPAGVEPTAYFVGSRLVQRVEAENNPRLIAVALSWMVATSLPVEFPADLVKVA